MIKIKFAVFISIFVITGCLSFALDNEDCIACHEDSAVKTSLNGENSTGMSYTEGSVHEGFDCTDCHQSIIELPHSDSLPYPDCSSCHEDSVVDYNAGVHGVAVEAGSKDVPQCHDCHGSHDILPLTDRNSSASRMNVVKLCRNCHEGDFVEDYSESIHADAFTKGGLIIAAICTDCHGYHKVLSSGNNESSTARVNIAKTCKNCHEDVYDTYSSSVHGKGLAAGNVDVPVCTDCHGSHKIQGSDSDEASDIIVKKCSSCHENEMISEKYSIPGQRFTTYMNSYHGVANKFGRRVVADCASCHGNHNILPSSDPLSPVHKDNLVKTCGNCHPGATENFTKGKMHISVTKEDSFGVWVVRKFYLWFIGLLMVLFLVHMAMEIYGNIRSRRKND